MIKPSGPFNTSLNSELIIAMIINSLDQLNNISLKILDKISKEDCILLFGEIGSVKTTLTRFFNKQSSKK